ncbi:MAG: diacylglycerol kinase family protein [Vicingaceae bacterium]
MKQLLMIVNPTAGEGGQEDFVKQVKKHCQEKDIQLHLHWTNGENDLEQVKAILQDKTFDAVFTSGGDGTFTQFAKLIAAHKLPIGIIPQGTSNGLATDLGIPANPIQAFTELVSSNNRIKIDQVLINDKLLLYHIGDIGANAKLIHSFESSEDSGYAAYSKHVFKELQNKEPFEYSIDTENENFSGSAQMIAICNARRFGSGIALNRISHPADGKFELVIFREIDLQTIIESSLASFWEGFLEDNGKEKRVIQTTQARLKLNPPSLLQIDGEVQNKTAEIKLELKPSTLELICNEDCPYLD